ncbi:unannotated protein [freshwater metagenome]|uniref:Unannotated protein n=1 Tax=freshwater metagenome TaxID=449393 RepID=A0A6J7L2I7_9ZZZZ
MRRRQPRFARVPVVELTGQFDESTINCDDRAREVRVGRCHFQNDISAPGLTDDHRLPKPEFTDENDEIVHDCFEVVAVVRFARLTVSALIDPHDRMAGRSEFRSNSVPHARIRGETMNEHEGRSRLIETARECPQLDVGCHRYPKFFGRHFVSLPAAAIDSHKPIADNTSTLERDHGVEPRTASTKAPIMSA